MSSLRRSLWDLSSYGAYGFPTPTTRMRSGCKHARLQGIGQNSDDACQIWFRPAVLSALAVSVRTVSAITDAGCVKEKGLDVQAGNLSPPNGPSRLRGFLDSSSVRDCTLWTSSCGLVHCWRSDGKSRRSTATRCLEWLPSKRWTSSWHLSRRLCHKTKAHLIDVSSMAWTGR